MREFLGRGETFHTETDVPPHTIIQRINETMSDVTTHTSLSTLFTGSSSLVPGRLYRTTETVAGTKKEIHDFSKRYKRRIVIKTTAREGIPNAASSLHFFHRPRMIAIRNGTVARRTKVADGPK